jgi:predicted 3-demethylubiquinone-9 3-methyltransferase (glyoxalase superfamily)
MTHPIYPCLWFNQNAKEAADYYLSIFKNARLLSENPYVVMLEINGSKVMFLNGGPEFTFNESMSLVVNCDDQEEIDHLWNTLTFGGKAGRCGWLKDKFGFSWQIVPAKLGEWMSNPKSASNVTSAFMQMTKFDISKLEEAAKS